MMKKVLVVLALAMAMAVPAVAAESSGEWLGVNTFDILVDGKRRGYILPVDSEEYELCRVMHKVIVSGIDGMVVGGASLHVLKEDTFSIALVPSEFYIAALVTNMFVDGYEMYDYLSGEAQEMAIFLNDEREVIASIVSFGDVTCASFLRVEVR